MASLSSGALTTVEDVKEQLGIDSSDHSKDNLIIRKINSATLMIERYIGRSIKAQNFTEYYDGGGDSGELTLRNYPIISVTSLSSRNVSDNKDDFTASDSGDYFIDSTGGRLKLLSGLYGAWDEWKVVYRAGYETVPADLAEACATLAGFYVDGASSGATGGAVVKRKQEGQREIEYFDPRSNNATSQNDIFDQLGITEVLDSYADINITGLR